MAFLHSFALPDFLDSLVSLFAAFVLGAFIGAERQYRQRGGGLRTHVLVSVGAATFVDIGMHLNGNPGTTQIIAYVVSGVGSLGAGVIMKQGSNVWGLNTAAYSIGQLAMRLMLSCRAVNRIAAQSYKPTFFVSFRRSPEKDKIHVVTDLGLHSAMGVWCRNYPA